MGNHQNAIADFSQAIKLDVEYQNAYFFKAISKLKSN